MTTKHTSGPWGVGQNLDPVSASNGEIAVRIDGNAEADCVAVVLAAPGESETEANALLIAAAPDLLAALEAAFPLIQDFNTQERMRAAIAKAKGEV